MVPAEDLFHTVEGDALCASCKLPWADEQARIAREGGASRFKPRPGFRLMCPECKLASMEVGESEFMLLARCLRCNRRTSQMRGGVFLAASLAMMGAVWLDVAMRARFFVLGTVLVGLALLVVRDLLRRRNHRVATVDEIDAADAALKKDRQRVAGEALRIAEFEPAPEGEHDARAVEEAAVAEAYNSSSAPDEGGRVPGGGGSVVS